MNPQTRTGIRWSIAILMLTVVGFTMYGWHQQERCVARLASSGDAEPWRLHEQCGIPYR